MSTELIRATDLKALYQSVNALHAENTSAAQAVAENVVRIGVMLWQIKEAAGHGNFAKAMADNCPNVTDRTCQNYMRLAKEMVVEQQVKLLAAPVEEGKSETVSDLAVVTTMTAPEREKKARELVEEMKWSELPFSTAELVKEIQGKQITEVYREYGVTRAPKIPQHAPPKELTPDEKIEAEEKQADELITSTISSLMMLLERDGEAINRRPKRHKELIDACVRVTKHTRAQKKKTKKGGK